MAIGRHFQTNIDGVPYDIEFKPGVWTGRHKLIVNGETINLPVKALASYTGMDVPVQIGAREGRFVLVDNKADIAVNGVFLGSGRPYAPLAPIPWWVWIFVAACIAIPFVAGGGALFAMIGLAGVILCLRVARLPLMPSVKALACLGVTLLTWGVFFCAGTLFHIPADLMGSG